MGYTPETPFDSIESSHQYIELLLETIEEARRDVDSDIGEARLARVERRAEALRIVAHKLERLSFHVTRSRRLLNDLRSLRRLLLEERSLEETEADIARAAGAD